MFSDNVNRFWRLSVPTSIARGPTFSSFRVNSSWDSGISKRICSRFVSRFKVLFNLHCILVPRFTKKSMIEKWHALMKTSFEFLGGLWCLSNNSLSRRLYLKKFCLRFKFDKPSTLHLDKKMLSEFLREIVLIW